MKTHTVLIGFAITAGFLLIVPASGGQACRVPPTRLVQGERREYRGHYANKAYGYSVTIPADLVGYDDVNPFYQHGFGLSLGKEPQSYLLVNGEPNSLEFAHPAEAATNTLRYLHKHASKVKSSNVTEMRLGQLKATLLMANYTCSGSSEGFVMASVVAISPESSNFYEITLYSRPDRFQHDRGVFDALVRSWKHLDAASMKEHSR